MSKVKKESQTMAQTSTNGLSCAQHLLLSRLSEGWTLTRSRSGDYPWITDHYTWADLISEDMGRCNYQTVESCVRNAWITKEVQDNNSAVYRLTNAGYLILRSCSA